MKNQLICQIAEIAGDECSDNGVEASGGGGTGYDLAGRVQPCCFTT